MAMGWRPSDRRHRRRLRGNCERTVDSLELPSPFDVFDFLATLAGNRGRPIVPLPMPATVQAQLPCGLLATTDRADYIFYAADTTALHQQHILLHEAAHLICGHDELAPVPGCSTQLLMPHLAPALVRRVLGRSVYTEPQEHEAELIASLIHHRAAREDERRTGSQVPASPLESLLTEMGYGFRD
jgi:hypothetical protein